MELQPRDERGKQHRERTKQERGLGEAKGKEAGVGGGEGQEAKGRER